MMHMQACLLAALLVLAGLPNPLHGYPTFYHDRAHATTCTEHPASPVGGHLPPVTDKDITVVASRKGTVVKDVCPGATYTLVTAFGGQERAALVTVSGGTVKEANVAGCTNALTTLGKAKVAALTAHWEVPCSLLGRVEVKVTTATSPTGPFKKASTGFGILPLSKCPNSRCKQAAQQEQAVPTVPSDRVVEPNPAGVAAPAPGAAAGSGAQPACPPSLLGYQCASRLGEGVTLHYSYGGSAPPANACTNTSSVGPAFAGQELAHFAVESELPGYVALGFPAKPGKMVPSDAVIGSIDAAAGSMMVGSYRVSGASTAGVTKNSGWATAMGVVGHSRPPRAGEGGPVRTTLVCFSRPVDAKGALVPHLDPAMVSLIWAAHRSSWSEKHDMDGALILNMATGQQAVLSQRAAATSVGVKYAKHIAHGALMLAAFCLIMPTAALLARHAWLLGGGGSSTAGSRRRRSAPGGKGGAAQQPAGGKAAASATGARGVASLHLLLQLLATLAAGAGFGLAMWTWYRRYGLGLERHVLYTPHFELGVGAMGMVALQLVAGLARWLLPGRFRGAWKSAHSVWGLMTILCGGANCILGAFLMRDLTPMPLLAWLVPAAGLLGLMLLSAGVLEVARARRRGQAAAAEGDDTESEWTEDDEADAAYRLAEHGGTASLRPSECPTNASEGGAEPAAPAAVTAQ